MNNTTNTETAATLIDSILAGVALPRGYSVRATAAYEGQQVSTERCTVSVSGGNWKTTFATAINIRNALRHAGWTVGAKRKGVTSHGCAGKDFWIGFSAGPAAQAVR